MVAVPVVILFIFATASALPQTNLDHELKDERIVTGSIINAIQALRKQIQDAGLDPLIVDKAELQHTVIPSFLEFKAFVDSLEFTGLSNIAINTMDYSVLLNRLRFDISLPEIYLSVGDSGVAVTLFGRKLQGQFNGQVSFRSVRLSGEVRINIGVISGISVRSLSLDFNLGGTDSKLNLIVRDRDFSDVINTVLNDTIPDLLKKNRFGEC